MLAARLNWKLAIVFGLDAGRRALVEWPRRFVGARGGCGRRGGAEACHELE